MSIIIRLQNLPITAKSADVRNFFGGLRIPDGGVHILGGENGDAFIGFNSDEDARLAMRKDGGKIKDSRVKLFLSSRMEMQYEVEKLTKCSIGNSPSHKSYSQERTLADEDSRYISSERMTYSQSPHKYREQSPDRRISLVQHHEKAESPVGYGSRPRSPRRRSRSPLRTQSSQKSPSPESNLHSKKNFKVSRRMPNYVNLRQIDLKQDKLDSSDQKNYNNNYPENKPSTSEIQAELERRITEAIEKNSEMMARGNIGYQESDAPGIMGENMHAAHYPGQNFPSGIPPNSFPQFPLPPPPPFFDNTQPFHAPAFQHSHAMNMSQQPIMPPPIPQPDVLMTNVEVGRQRNINGFYATISGLDPLWDCKEIQMMLKGIYAPQINIRWEIDNMGFKTGTAFVKLINKEDFDNVLKRMTFNFNGRRITVSECPDFLSRSYFQPAPEYMNENMQQNRDLCYKLKGLPFTCTHEDVISFFQGFEVADVVIIYGKDNKATGTGFVSFTNRKDFEEALCQNGKKILHRYIEMMPTSEIEMMEIKMSHPSAKTFTSYSQLLHERNLPPSRRPLCAVITGLPFHTSIKKLNTFFSDSGLKPDAFHITLNKKKQCDGRTFLEFTNFRDFDLALKLHGSSFRDNIICIKQTLYDEMIKILDTVKAKHHFETPVSASDVPEKVPYLWEPPDSYEEHDKFHNSWLGDQYLYSSNNKFQNEFKPMRGPNSINETGISNHFFPNHRMHSGRNFQPRFNREFFRKQENPPFMAQNNSFRSNANEFPGNFRPFMNQNNPFSSNTNEFPGDFRPFMTQNNSFGSNANEFPGNFREPIPGDFREPIPGDFREPIPGDFREPIPGDFREPIPGDFREPIKFNVNKPSTLNMKSNETFDSSKNAEKKSKLSKLSPEKEASKISLNKELEVQSSKTKDVDFKKKSPERKDAKKRSPERKDSNLGRRDSHSERSFKERRDSISERNYEEKDSRNDKPYKLESKKDTFSKDRYERESRRNYERKIDSHHRSSSPVDSSYRERMSKECVVHMTNVSTSVGTMDLMEFLREFVYYKDTISRRYTDDNEPTGDVRVTFYNKSEAELAIRELNGRRLHDVRVNMFIA